MATHDTRATTRTHKALKRTQSLREKPPQKPFQSNTMGPPHSEEHPQHFERNFPNKPPPPPPPPPPSMDPCVKPAALCLEQSQVLTEASPWTLRSGKNFQRTPPPPPPPPPPLLLLLPPLLPPDPGPTRTSQPAGSNQTPPPLHLFKSQRLYESTPDSDPAQLRRIPLQLQQQLDAQLVENQQPAVIHKPAVMAAAASCLRLRNKGRKTKPPEDRAGRPLTLTNHTNQRVGSRIPSLGKKLNPK
ncbi:unnamed protein product [Pleuronectes platessa]|uniref:Uncharacterized protein n=1 Tax=Pleuronectes platessa TaxID=8262 RepID=A0A9N7U2A7_PLEPL|nr:unnamed protein product [Pleuronectes platessa]